MITPKNKNPTLLTTFWESETETEANTDDVNNIDMQILWSFFFSLSLYSLCSVVRSEVEENSTLKKLKNKQNFLFFLFINFTFILLFSESEIRGERHEKVVLHKFSLFHINFFQLNTSFKGERMERNIQFENLGDYFHFISSSFCIFI